MENLKTGSKLQYAQRSKVLVRGLTSQQKVTSTSLKALWVLTRHNRPFTDAEVFKEVMVTVALILSGEHQAPSMAFFRQLVAKTDEAT